MSNPPVPNRRGQLRRAHIVAAARQLFTEVGYRGASMSGIAECSAVTHAGLLYHFATKEDVLEAVLSDEKDRGMAFLKSAEETTTRDHLDALSALVARNSEDPSWARLYSILLGESVSENHPVRERMAQRFSDIASPLAEHLGGIRHETSGCDDGDLASMARVLIAVMDGLQFQALIGSDDNMTRDFETAATLVRLALEGDRGE